MRPWVGVAKCDAPIWSSSSAVQDALTAASVLAPAAVNSDAGSVTNTGATLRNPPAGGAASSVIAATASVAVDASDPSATRVIVPDASNAVAHTVVGSERRGAVTVTARAGEPSWPA